MFSTLGSSEYIIHHPSQIDIYAATNEQLEMLMLNRSSEWKGHIQTALSILITSIINMMALGYDMSNASFRMNLGIGMLSFVAGLIAIKFYVLEKRRSEERLAKILSQPVQRLEAHEEEL